jgi:Cd2+/Zn2+-exporting ATPase
MGEKKEYILEGLCCPNCAAKIEKEVGTLSAVNEASINMVNNKLSILLEAGKAGDITEAVKRIVAAHEPSVRVTEVTTGSKAENMKDKKVSGMEDDTKKYLFRLGAAVLFAAVFSLVPVTGQVKLAAFILAYVFAGYEVLVTAVKNIFKGELFDENFLMGFASLGAFLIGEQVEAIAVLVFYGVGELLQDMAVHRSRKNITGLMDIRPDYANKIINGEISVIPPEQAEVGDAILVKPGEKIPLDGIVRKGGGFVDTRALTGESVPREVSEEDTVLSGSVNLNGLLEIEVTKPFGEATVSKILELVQNAGSKKAESEKFITRFARVYTPAVVAAAAVVAVLPPLLGFGPFTVWLYRALSFLIISCPCALVISIPLSFFGGIGGGAKQGVLVKGGNYLDALKRVDTIVFDKTGTLTKGVFEVSRVCPSEASGEEELIRLAAIAENHSNHPIAKSIISYYNKNFGPLGSSDIQITEIAGHGVIAEYNKDMIYAGNEKLMVKYDIPVTAPQVSGSIVHVAYGGRYLGYILISDEIKSGAKEVMAALKQMGIRRTVMLTGDHENTAKEIAGLCRVDEYEAELLPQDKVEWFDRYKKQIAGKGKIVFVGDGINDAPVLAGADIGIAMGGIGSDAAIEAADVVIMNDEIGKVVTAIKVARKTGRIVTQNIVFALGIKALIMVLAFLGITSIWFAIFADVGVALLALLNAMRAMRLK